MPDVAIQMLAEGRHEGAIRLLKELVAVGDATAEATRALAEAYLGCDDLEHARRYCEQAVSTDLPCDVWLMQGLLITG